MKTTIEIPDALLEAVRGIGRQEGRSLRELTEEALRGLVAQRGRRGVFTLRRATFKGQGLQPAFADGQWERMRDAAYEGRGA